MHRIDARRAELVDDQPCPVARPASDLGDDLLRDGLAVLCQALKDKA